MRLAQKRRSMELIAGCTGASELRKHASAKEVHHGRKDPKDNHP